MHFSHDFLYGLKKKNAAKYQNHVNIIYNSVKSNRKNYLSKTISEQKQVIIIQFANSPSNKLSHSRIMKNRCERR